MFDAHLIGLQPNLDPIHQLKADALFRAFTYCQETRQHNDQDHQFNPFPFTRNECVICTN